MELNALTRWISVGKDLHLLGRLEGEIKRLTELRDAKRRQNGGRLPTQADKDEEERENHYYRSLIASLHAASSASSSSRASPSGSPVLSPISESLSSDSLSSPLSSTTTTDTTAAASTASTTISSLRSVDGELITLTSLPSKPPRRPITWQEVLKRSSLRFAKGFGIGYGGKAFFSLLPVLFRSRGNPFRILAAFKRIAFGDPVRYGCFLGSYLCVFESIMRISLHYRHIFGILSPDSRPIVAGSFAGLSMMFLPKGSRVAIMLFFLVRAIELLACHLVERGYLPSVPHADALLMAVSSSQVIWTWMFQPKGLDKTYKRFVDHHGGWPPSVQHAYQILSEGKRNLSNEEVAAINKAHSKFEVPRLPSGVVPPRPSPYNEPLSSYAYPIHWSRRRQCCHVIHPHNTSCILGWMRTWSESFGRALPVYIPVYLLPLVLLRSKRLLKSPIPSLMHTGVGIARSSAFLASYCSGNFLVQCFLRNFIYGEETSNNLVGFITGFMSGLTVMIESKPRRIELALYVFSHAIDSAWNNARQWGWVKPIPNAEVALFCASVAVIMHAYVRQPLLLRRSYLGLLGFFFGAGGRGAGFMSKPKHAASVPLPPVPPLDLPAAAASAASSAHQYVTSLIQRVASPALPLPPPPPSLPLVSSSSGGGSDDTNDTTRTTTTTPTMISSTVSPQLGLGTVQ